MRVKRTRKVCSATHLEYSQCDFTHAPLPNPAAVTIALCLTTVAPLVPTGANLFADFQFHDPLKVENCMGSCALLVKIARVVKVMRC